VPPTVPPLLFSLHQSPFFIQRNHRIEIVPLST
jgi:hypothetical protein